MSRKKMNRFYCFDCLRKFYRRALAPGDLCPFCRVPARANTTKVVASVVTRLRRQRGIEPPKKKDEYAEYLASPEWKVIRERVWLRDGRECQACGETAEVVHHKSYDRIVLEGLRDADLVSLCHPCHTAIEFTANEKGRHVKNGLREANHKLATMLETRRRQLLKAGTATPGARGVSSGTGR